MGHAISTRRGRVLKQARALAKSGQHRDHVSITLALSEAGAIDEARIWFEDRRFLAQLNALCAMAAERAASPR